MIARYYAQIREDQRLAEPIGRLEMERTQEVILRYLPPPPAVIVGVGGGPGAYSRWLAKLGYEAHLVDLTPKHVEQALALGGIASVSVGDARALEWPDGAAASALLLGPLYHLTERAERVLALRVGLSTIPSSRRFWTATSPRGTATIRQSLTISRRPSSTRRTHAIGCLP
ncbi:MAG: methyltransferase domain-containing protein [Bryobacteraceae bacterium]